MDANIENKKIGNRKIVIELRFEPTFSIIDKRGQIIDKLRTLDCYKEKFGEMNSTRLVVGNAIAEEDCSSTFAVFHNRISYISRKIDSLDSYFSQFEKSYKVILDTIGELNILRIGCRILGTYKIENQDFNEILKTFLSAFPSDFLYNNFEAKDFCFQLVHDKGMYRIGPVNRNDNFLVSEFDYKEHNEHIGFAIDTDNYITNKIESINSQSLIKDVFMYSLTVEKNIYNKILNLF